MDHSNGECTVQIRMPKVSVVIAYDAIVDDIEEYLLLDATMMLYAGIQLKYDTQELIRKDKIVKGVASFNQNK